MQRVDLIIPWRKDPIQLWMPKVTNTTGDGYSMTFEDEHGGEGKILFNQKSIAAVVISPPAGGPEQDAKTALREPERETAGPDLGEERGIAGRDNGAEPDLDTAQEPGTTQEPSPREEPPADPT